MIKDINVVHTSESWMYNNSTKAIGYELAEDWIYFWTFYMPIALILYIFSKDITLLIKGSFFILFIVAMTISRKKITNVFLYILINIIFLGIIFVISFSLLEKLAFIIPMLLSIGFSIHLRREDKVHFLTISNLTTFEMIILICNLVALKLNLELIQNLTYISAIIVGISLTIYLNVARISQLMIWEGDFIKNYKEKMDNLKIKSGLLIGAFIGVSVLIFSLTGFNKFLDRLTLSFSNLFNMTNNTADPVKQTINIAHEDDTKPNALEAYKKLKAGKASGITEIIVKIISIIIILLVIIVLLRLLYLLIKKILEFYKSLKYHKVNIKEERESIFSIEDFKENIKEKTVGIKNMFQDGLITTNKKRIRKVYSKKIKEYSHKGVELKKQFTPSDISENVKTILDMNIQEATVIYEKARYAQGDCSKEELDKIKSLF